MNADTDWVAVVIEDDPDVRELIEVVLGQSGFTTVLAANGEAGLEAVRKHRPLLTTVDVQMPGMNGIETTRAIREISNTYLIMITALSGEEDLLRGFEAGADDYLVKPFRARELWARAESMMRRPRDRVVPGAATGWATDAVRVLREQAPLSSLKSAGARVGATPVVDQQPVGADDSQPGPRAAEPLRHNGLEIDVETRTVELVGTPIELTRTEFDLLASLVASGRRVRGKGDLVLVTRGHDLDSSDYVTDSDKRAVEVHIANLRRKLGDDASRPRFVETVRGVGYRAAATAQP